MENSMKKIAIAATLALMLVYGQTVSAAARQWSIDSAHSNIYFGVAHIFSEIRGQFNEFTAEVHFDPGNLEQSRFSFQISTDSIDTNIAKRDKHLQSADFFDAAQYPAITFESKNIRDAGNGLYEIHGTLNIKGKDRDFLLPLSLAGIKEHPAAKDKEVAGFNGRVTIDRLEYGVGDGTFYKKGIVGKDVEIFVSLELLSSK